MTESHLGLGVMVNMLFGDTGASAALDGSIGKTIAKVVVDPSLNGGDGAMVITFAGGGSLSLYDSGRSCCEHRYMVSDADLDSFVGAKLQDVEVLDAGTIENGYDVHEVSFLNVRTSKGIIDAATHNEHNGYYGGFWLTASYSDSE